MLEPFLSLRSSYFSFLGTQKSSQASATAFLLSLLLFLWLYWYEPRSQVLFACFRNLFVNTRLENLSFIRHGYAHHIAVEWAISPTLSLWIPTEFQVVFSFCAVFFIGILPARYSVSSKFVKVQQSLKGDVVRTDVFD